MRPHVVSGFVPAIHSNHSVIITTDETALKVVKETFKTKCKINDRGTKKKKMLQIRDHCDEIVKMLERF